MATPTVDKLVKGNLVMHDHSESDLGAILDSRYVNITGDTMTGDLDLNNNDITNVSTINGGTISGNNSGDQDLSGLLTKTQFADIKRLGFLNRTETTISFDGTNTFTLTDAGSGWSYYRDGLKYTITGDKTVTLSATPPATADEYFIYIDATDGTLTASTTAWTLRDSKVPVATIAFNNTLTPNYWLADERHQALLDSRMQYYLHKVDGAHLADVPTLSGYTIDTDTNAAKTVGISQATLLDQDIIHTVDALTDPDGTTDSYVVWYRTSASVWAWKYSKMPFAYNTSTNAIQYDSAGTLTDASSFGPGALTRWINSYLLISNRTGASRHIIVPGRAEFSTLTAAQAEDVSGFDWAGFEVDEAVIAYRMTWTTYTATSLGKCMLASAPQLINLTATTTITASTEHNSLTGIQGGTTDEYYHLTSADYTGQGTGVLVRKSYVDSILGDANALVYKGVVDCSDNHNYPAADAGHLYVVSVAGKIGGASGVVVETGDMLICNTDSTSSGDQATVGSKWNIIEKNIVGAVTGPASATDGHVAQFDGATGKVIKDTGLTLSGTNTGDVTVSNTTTIDLSLTNQALTASLNSTLKSNYDTAYQQAHSVVTLGINTANGLSILGQELALNDVFVQLTGDTMTGELSLPSTEIGEKDPGYFNVIANGTPYIYRANTNLTDDTPLFVLRRAKGSIASPTAVESGYGLGTFEVGAHDGTKYTSGWNGGAGFSVYATQNWSSTAHGSKLAFLTTPDDTTNWVQRMVIDQSGKVGIGVSSPSTTLDVNGTGRAVDFITTETGFGVGARATGNVHTTGDVSHFTSTGNLTGFSWQGSPFVTATTHTYIRNDYLYIGHSSTNQRMFYAKAVTNSASAWQIKKVECRVRNGVSSNVGLRFDDGTDNNYGQVFITSLNNGTYRVDFSYRVSGGTAVTVNSSVIKPNCEFIGLAMYCYYTGGNYYAYAYIFGEDGTWINMTGFNSTALANIPTSGRVGIMMNTLTTAANPGLLDWYYDDFG